MSTAVAHERSAAIANATHHLPIGRWILNGAAGVVLSIPVAGFLSVSVRHWREYRSIERLVRQAAIARGNKSVLRN